MALAEALRTIEVPKKPFQIKPEIKTVLKEKQGIEIFTLEGKSIQGLKKSGAKFQSTWHIDFPDFESRRSPASEVGIVPQIIFPGTIGKNLQQQEEMARDYDKKIREEFNEVKVIMGNTSYNLELLTKLSKRANENNEQTDKISVRSGDLSTIPSIYTERQFHSVTVGSVNSENGILVNGYDKGSSKANVGAIFYIVPIDHPDNPPIKKVK